ncbi:hypothetical protein BH11PSE12_BH11PSE12_27580 [soil metagenome]
MPNTKTQSLGSADASKDHQNVTTVIVTCACNRDFTLDELAEVYPDRKRSVLETFLEGLNLTMTHYDIRSCLRKAHFLAQVGHESGELKYTAELVSVEVEKKNYGGYKGRGLMQLTGEKNYIAYGAYIKQDLTGDNRLKVEEPKLATDSAGWFWVAGRTENLNIAADQNDLLYISAEINGGFNGLEGSTTSRLTLLKNAVDALHVKACLQLDALFTVFPEFEKFEYSTYPFKKSRAFDKPDMAFAWAYWHDPKSKMSGTRKNIEESKLGYSRYLELLETKTIKAAHLPKRRFGIGRNEMKIHAETRLNELSKTPTGQK